MDNSVPTHAVRDFLLLYLTSFAIYLQVEIRKIQIDKLRAAKQLFKIFVNKSMSILELSVKFTKAHFLI